MTTDVAAGVPLCDCVSMRVLDYYDINMTHIAGLLTARSHNAASHTLTDLPTDQNISAVRANATKAQA